MENQERQVGVCDGRKGEGMIRYADERQDLMTANENQIVVYQPSDTVRLDVRFENRTVWLSQKQMAVLFGCSSENIIVHLKKIYREEELSEAATAKENLVVQTEGNRTVSRKIKFYNLDAIISVGFRVNTKLGIQFRQWANGVIQSYLLKGYAINERLNILEDRVDRRIAKTEQDVVELKEKVDFFVQTKEPPLQGVFYDGQLWDARALVLKLVGSAKRSLLLIDNWATVETLDLFAKKRKGVKVTIITSKHYRKKVPHPTISAADVKTFNAQYLKLAVRYNESFHDRFLIIDDKELYLIGASLKDLGHKCFGFTKMDAAQIRRIKAAAFSPS